MAALSTRFNLAGISKFEASLAVADALTVSGSQMRVSSSTAEESLASSRRCSQGCASVTMTRRSPRTGERAPQAPRRGSWYTR